MGTAQLRYSKEANMFEWQGRVDSEDGDKGLRWHQRVKLDINDDTSSNVDTSA